MEYTYFVYCQVVKENKIIDAQNKGGMVGGMSNIIINLPFEIKSTADLRSAEAYVCEEMKMDRAIIINLSKLAEGDSNE